MPSGFVTAAASCSRRAASGTSFSRASAISSGCSSCGTRSDTLKASTSCRSSRCVAMAVVAITRRRLSGSSGAFLRSTSSVCSTVLEKRGPTGVYLARRRPRRALFPGAGEPSRPANVGECRAVPALDEPLDVVDDHDRQGRLVRVHEGLLDGLALGALRVPDESVRAQQPHEGKFRRDRRRGRQRRLARRAAALQEHGHERRPRRGPHLVHEPIQGPLQVPELGPVVHDAVAVQGLQQRRLGPERRLGLPGVERVVEVALGYS
mmetsp:Transcript_21015/g.62710  ORF Transcript_21015/g.62710 Transcript_21015/m.62710 type:complete len:264 (+) Transcript_21015:146-937(+)